MPLGLVVAALFRKPLVVQLVFAAIGLPFFFLAGFAWPFEAMPQIVRMLATLVPSTLAIEGLVNVGQLGASLSDVRYALTGLWLLAAFYGSIAVALEFRSLQQSPSSASANTGRTGPWRHEPSHHRQVRLARSLRAFEDVP